MVEILLNLQALRLGQTNIRNAKVTLLPFHDYPAEPIFMKFVMEKADPEEGHNFIKVIHLKYGIQIMRKNMISVHTRACLY